MSEFRHGAYWCNPGWMPFKYCYCPDAKNWARLMKFLGAGHEPYPDDTPGRMTTMRNQETDEIVLIVSFGDLTSVSPVDIMGLVAHECMHMWQEVKRYIGEKAPGDEMEAYALQAMCCEILMAMLRHNPGLFHLRYDVNLRTETETETPAQAA
ncbi:MAG: hypothetical protein LPK02_07040 [Rhodobacterales bacterium]|nr:hypothetical protein [Rhodobacterales bacterium]